jgi:hypothetical protein
MTYCWFVPLICITSPIWGPPFSVYIICSECRKSIEKSKQWDNRHNYRGVRNATQPMNREDLIPLDASEET